MTTENSASSSANINVNAHGSHGSSLASRVKLRKLTAVKTQRTAERNTKASASSEYFAQNSRNDGEKSICKRKRAAKTVLYITDTEKSNTSGNDGSPVVDCAKSTRPLRGKRHTAEVAKETLKTEACEKSDVPEVMSTTESDVLISHKQQPFSSSLQSCNESCSFSVEASLDENNDTSSSDVDWEDVEGRSFLFT